MSITSLDGKRFAEMVLQGASLLSANAQLVDALNVFPVPDGDTGTNMNLSMTSGAKEVQKNIQSHIGNVSISLSKGLLMGARGNSGVILSQLFRGFGKAIEGKSSLTTEEFAQALQTGVDTAYKAVMKPVEGTILTVAKDAAKKGVSVAKNESDFIKLMESIVKEGQASLNRTPDLLPVLKEVGVVDSGGQGLLFVYEGFLAELKGEKVSERVNLPSMNDLVSAEHHKSAQDFMSTEDIEFGYCTEFMVQFEEGKKSFDEETFRQDLSGYGDSLLVISDEELAKVHIHSEEPGNVLSYGHQYGSLIKIKIENMREQHSSIVGESRPVAKAETPKKEVDFAIVTVAMGEGVAELFRSIGATVVIEGGQTMNPSTEDIVKAVEEVNAKKVIIMPNNKNIIMAAEQAAEVLSQEVAVVPTKTVPQGMSALLAFNPGASVSENQAGMSEAAKQVKSGQVTFAVRDTSIDGITISKDDFMGIDEGKIVIAEKDLKKAATGLLEQMLDEDSEILTIIYGEDVSEEDVEALQEYIEQKYGEVEVEVHNGKQPLYSYIFSVE
ncbi:putative enzyme structurally related to dihydroxyacetone/glyceraldehyde kinase [Bacillus sp. 349Y]|uniref:DAK2 domain-containing protein n=1 Tax=Rossellomorea marisflavi TaxID=189381 RepID=UPI0012F18606|nr:DAK2 domain-containing protein [Rossellomorea marisflavi]UKS67097.1 DAK2 domain-containing protein [Rossellomorea marisflavi]VXC66701.1 putative enzyme structurally related to dihydroxyacetone/glyceraldehyde kinase [Bacillus sp. 349Y]